MSLNYMRSGASRSTNVRNGSEKFAKVSTGFPRIFKNYFPYFFNTKLKDFNTPLFTFIFQKFYWWNTMQKTCRTAISGKEQNLNKQMAEFGISKLFHYFMNILAKFITFSRSWKPISKFNTFNTAWEPCFKQKQSPNRVEVDRCAQNKFICFHWVIK